MLRDDKFYYALSITNKTPVPSVSKCQLISRVYRLKFEFIVNTHRLCVVWTAALARGAKHEKEMLAAARSLQAGDLRGDGGNALPQYHRANSYTAGGVAPGAGLSFSSTMSVFTPGPGARRDARPPSYEAPVQTLVATRAGGRDAHTKREAAARSASDADGDGVNESAFNFAGHCIGTGTGSGLGTEQAGARRRSVEVSERGRGAGVGVGEEKRDLCNAVQEGGRGGGTKEQSPLVPRLPLPRPRALHPAIGQQVEWRGHRPSLRANGGSDTLRSLSGSRSRSRSPLAQTSYARD